MCEMNRSHFGAGIRTALDLIREMEQETAAAQREDALSARVMQLFREEDIDGISLLMAEQKIAREFREDLAVFVKRWNNRLRDAEREEAP